MTTIAIVAILLALLIAGFLIVASMRFNTFRVQRSIDINAPADKIYPPISDYKHWASWSPYEKMDPAMRRTFTGSSSGKGAIYEWDGNKTIGRGRMEIIDAVPSSKIGIKLDFFSPFEAHNVAEFTMLPKGESTNVTWAMHGLESRFPKFASFRRSFVCELRNRRTLASYCSSVALVLKSALRTPCTNDADFRTATLVPFVAKIMHMIFSMDRMVGGQFEEGLAKMKAVAER